MNETEYFAEWDLINSKFDNWFSGQRWKDQEKYLRKSIKKQFKISKEDIDKIFNMFNWIYPDGEGMSFDWKSYQLPTLIGITARYISI